MDVLELGRPALAVVDMQNDFVDHDVGSYAIGAERMVTRIGRVVAAAGGLLAGIYHCPHTPEAGCSCRKPAAGMVRRMERELGYSARGAPLIGDKLSDLELARNVGSRPILVRTGYGASTLAGLTESHLDVFADLAQAAEALIREDSP